MKSICRTCVHIAPSSSFSSIPPMAVSSGAATRCIASFVTVMSATVQSRIVRLGIYIAMQTTGRIFGFRSGMQQKLVKIRSRVTQAQQLALKQSSPRDACSAMIVDARSASTVAVAGSSRVSPDRIVMNADDRRQSSRRFRTSQLLSRPSRASFSWAPKRSLLRSYLAMCESYRSTRKVGQNGQAPRTRHGPSTRRRWTTMLSNLD
mmetsp:Transcript_32503/g.50397  ORF Transcript_32503/g.50397 Transcript_32503/m.50397 type:complete len:206 (+) Transcript_32503:560-1177(+)